MDKLQIANCNMWTTKLVNIPPYVDCPHAMLWCSDLLYAM